MPDTDLSRSLLPAVLGGAVLAAGLTAGLLLVFAHAVMPGLARLGDAAMLTAFWRIDTAIANPWMGLTWAGGPILCGAALLLSLRRGDAVLALVVVAAVLVTATVVVTAVVHLPLNAEVADAAPAFVDAVGLRARFESRWVPWHLVRTLTSVGATAALAAALALLARAPA